jgi:hypothetical protein
LDIFIVIYLDNILIFSKSKVKHIDHIKLVLQALDLAELRLKPKKCEFHKEEVKFLGFTVSVHGVKMSKSKIKVVKDWPTLKNVKNIQEFLGFINFN